MQQIASPGWIHETSAWGLVHWDNSEGLDGEGGVSGAQDGEHI